MTKHHFDGRRFHNRYPDNKDRKIRELIRWFRTRKPSKWPKHVHLSPQQVPCERIPEGTIHATFINHSTVLIQMDNINILTDPIWSKRCGPLPFIGPKRKSPAGINFADLPPIDLVLVTHNHYDHMDLPTLRQLQKDHQPQFCVSLGNKRFLESKGLHRVTELDWWQSTVYNEKLKVTFVPSQHFARRGVFDANKTLWGGFVLEGSEDPVYFAGDTGYGTHFKQLYEKFGEFCLAFLPIGVYSPRWYMSAVHMDPADAVQAHLDLHAKQSVGIHFGTFKLSDEAMGEPVIFLGKELAKRKIPPAQFVALKNGETLQIFLEEQ